MNVSFFSLTRLNFCHKEDTAELFSPLYPLSCLYCALIEHVSIFSKRTLSLLTLNIIITEAIIGQLLSNLLAFESTSLLLFY